VRLLEAPHEPPIARLAHPVETSNLDVLRFVTRVILDLSSLASALTYFSTGVAALGTPLPPSPAVTFPASHRIPPTALWHAMLPHIWNVVSLLPRSPISPPQQVLTRLSSAGPILVGLVKSGLINTGMQVRFVGSVDIALPCVSCSNLSPTQCKPLSPLPRPLPLLPPRPLPSCRAAARTFLGRVGTPADFCCNVPCPDATPLAAALRSSVHADISHSEDSHAAFSDLTGVHVHRIACAPPLGKHGLDGNLSIEVRALVAELQIDHKVRSGSGSADGREGGGEGEGKGKGRGRCAQRCSTGSTAGTRFKSMTEPDPQHQRGAHRTLGVAFLCAL